MVAPVAMTAPSKVFVAGAAGRTGRIVQSKLAKSGVSVIGLVRRKEQQADVSGVETVVGDIRQPETYAERLKEADALVILTSAVPQKEDAPADAPPGPPKFYFREGEEPEQIDWVGQRNQIDAAKAGKVEHVVLVGSMGGESEDHPLNKIANGNILKWKRKSEQYLIDSGLDYTVIHPGGLLDQPGGERELLVGKNDNFITTETRTVPRADVAEVVVQALMCPAARNKAFDLVSKPPGEGAQPTSAWEELFAQTTPGL